MKDERPGQRTLRYESGSWRDVDMTLPQRGYLLPQLNQFDPTAPSAREHSRLLHLLGLINYRILKGSRVYIEVGGVVYKTLCGLYWRSVFTGVEHYLLRCEEVSWIEGSHAIEITDLPIVHTKDGWSAQGNSLMFMLNAD
jgi:hypothetical protein